MDRIIGISDRTNSALHALALASCNGGSIAANRAAERLGVSPTYLAKILQLLAAKSIIASTRGIGGGFSLTRPASAVSCMEILEALDGPLPERHCLFAKAICVTGSCAFSVLCAEMDRKIRDALNTTTVADIAKSFACS
jgi:Rrf2 family protein